MATQNVCSFNKYGFCKFQERCRKHHEKNLCERVTCVVKECILRHPKFCKFLRDYGYCIFGQWCYFSHKLTIMNYNADNTEIKELKDKLEHVNNKIQKFEDKIMEKTKEIEILEQKCNGKPLDDIMMKMDMKTEIFEEKLNSMKMCVIDKDEQIVNLEAKVKSMESKFEDIAIIQSNFKKAIDENIQKIKELMEKEKSEHDKTFKCDKCNFSTNSRSGLKIHEKKKHTIVSNNKTYPKKCDLCEKMLNSESEMRKHVASHSYTNSKFKCDECEFLGGNDATMQVHIGKYHTDKFECGLCYIEEKDQESLEIHLATCEVFECGKCDERLKSISDLKKHIKEKKYPGGFATIHHLKGDRNNCSEISVRQYCSRDLQT